MLQEALWASHMTLQKLINIFYFSLLFCLKLNFNWDVEIVFIIRLRFLPNITQESTLCSIDKAITNRIGVERTLDGLPC